MFVGNSELDFSDLVNDYAQIAFIASRSFMGMPQMLTISMGHLFEGLREFSYLIPSGAFHTLCEVFLINLKFTLQEIDHTPFSELAHYYREEELKLILAPTIDMILGYFLRGKKYLEPGPSASLLSQVVAFLQHSVARDLASSGTSGLPRAFVIDAIGCQLVMRLRRQAAVDLNESLNQLCLLLVASGDSLQDSLLECVHVLKFAKKFVELVPLGVTVLLTEETLKSVLLAIQKYLRRLLKDAQREEQSLLLVIHLLDLLIDYFTVKSFHGQPHCIPNLDILECHLARFSKQIVQSKMYLTQVELSNSLTEKLIVLSHLFNSTS